MSEKIESAVRNHALGQGLIPWDQSMISDRDGTIEGTGEVVPANSVVAYLGHVVGGMVSVQLADRRRVVMHPHCFPNLRKA